jgi:hypothetical protein
MQCAPPYAAYATSGGSGSLSVPNAAVGGDAGVETAATAGNGPSGINSSSSSDSEPKAGCQLGAGRAAGTGGGASVFALFGLIGLMRRRRH